MSACEYGSVARHALCLKGSRLLQTEGVPHPCILEQVIQTSDGEAQTSIPRVSWERQRDAYKWNFNYTLAHRAGATQEINDDTHCARRDHTKGKKYLPQRKSCTRHLQSKERGITCLEVLLPICTIWFDFANWFNCAIWVCAICKQTCHQKQNTYHFPGTLVPHAARNPPHPHFPRHCVSSSLIGLVRISLIIFPASFLFTCFLLAQTTVGLFQTRFSWAWRPSGGPLASWRGSFLTIHEFHRLMLKKVVGDKLGSLTRCLKEKYLSFDCFILLFVIPMGWCLG